MTRPCAPAARPACRPRATRPTLRPGRCPPGATALVPAGLTALSALLCALLLVACGGGGGGTPGEPLPPATPPACLALPEAVTWFAGPADNDWNDVLIDAEHRIWLAGYAGGRLGESNLGPVGDSRAVLRVLAADGRLLWDSGTELDTPGTDIAEALALSPTGTVFVAGRSTGTLDGPANAGQFDSFVAWHDAPAPAAGWRRFQTGDARPQQPRRLALAGDDGLLLAGYDDIHVVERLVQAWADPFVLRLDRLRDGPAGDRLGTRWQQRFGTAAQDTLDGLAVAADGAVYLTGAAQGDAAGPWVRQLDAEGRLRWHARYAAAAVDNIAAIRAQPDGTVLIAGTSSGSFHGGTAHGGQDGFVARLAGDDGRVLAVWQFGSAQGEWVTDMVVDRAGHILVLGETLGSLVPGQAPAGAADLFVARLAPDGRLLALRQWGTAADEQARRLAVDGCGRVVAVAASQRDGRRAGVLWFWAP